MLIKVKVSPNSKKGEIRKRSKDSYEVKVKEKPVNGKANKAVLQALSSYFKISKAEIRLVRGSKTRNKLFEIELKKKSTSGLS